MQIAGMICEYNPFHLGHLALVEETRRQGATHIAAVMSGNYVQRGEPALLEKRMRAKQALRCGVDLVVELPLPWAMSTAETFARGGVFLLDCLGADVISFGSECGNAALLIKAAKDLLSTEFPPLLREELQNGCTFARARERALARLSGKKPLQSCKPQQHSGGGVLQGAPVPVLPYACVYHAAGWRFARFLH
ncbi:MAG: nucleotidyltransferase family protein [Anaeromassilibacillus sp.]